MAMNGTLSAALTTFPLGINGILCLSKRHLAVASGHLDTNGKLEPG